MEETNANDHKVDRLLKFNLDTIVAAKPHLANWAAAKRVEMRGADWLEIMRWMAFGLDGENQAIVAKRLGVTVIDFRGLENILRSFNRT